MSDGYVKKLLDPAKRGAVIRTLPIRTGDLRKDLLEDKQVAIPMGGQFDYLHVAKANRIAYFDIRPENWPSDHLQLFVEDVQVSTQFRSGRNAKTLRPLFYLPYQRNNIARMKLSEPGTYNGPPVRFFTTAMIDGCSVYIEGPGATPKVSHANAQAVQPTRTTDSWAAKQIKIQAKITHMDTGYGHLRKAAAAVVERPHYIADDPVELLQVKTAFANAHGVPVNRVTDYQPFGAVLGFKDGNSWSFWLQKNGVFNYRRRTTDPRDTAKYWVIEAREVWPNGGGHFRLIP